MELTPIWDSSYRYKTFRLENAEPQEVYPGVRCVHQRVRLTYVDPLSDGHWSVSMVDVEGYNPVTLAPMPLHYKEPDHNPNHSTDWLPAWLRRIAIDNLPGGESGQLAFSLDLDPDPGPPPAVALVTPVAPKPGGLPVPPGVYEARVSLDEKDPTNVNLFKIAEVRTLGGQSLQPPVTWGKTSPEIAETQVLPPVVNSEETEVAQTQVLPKLEEQ